MRVSLERGIPPEMVPLVGMVSTVVIAGAGLLVVVGVRWAGAVHGASVLYLLAAVAVRCLV